jgi:predicted lipoprotein with Yx(FWY)xxD motif
MRPDGSSPATSKGHPVDLYTGDHKAGPTNGQGVNALDARWFALGDELEW